MVVYSKRLYSNGAEQHNIVYNGKLGVDLLDIIAKEGFQAAEDKIATLGGGHCSRK
jgi:hypothetical protein